MWTDPSRGKSSDEMRRALGERLPVALTKRNPSLNEARLSAKERAVEWATAELREPFLPDGTWAPPCDESLMFGAYWWAAMRKCVADRDGGRCLMCGSVYGLEAHHILPRHLGGSDHPRNLMTLCRGCHMAVHENLGDLEQYRREQDGHPDTGLLAGAT